MSRDNGTRRSIFRRHAGRAFLRFLVGELLLVVLCSVFYLFVLQGKVDLDVGRLLNKSEETAEVPVELTPEPAPESGVNGDAVPGETVPQAESGNNGEPAVNAETANAPEAGLTSEPTPELTPVPTIEPTAEPTPEPTPVPTSTPIPFAMIGQPLSEVRTDLGAPDVSEQLKTGLRELRLFEEAGQNIVYVRGYGYIEGADAAESKCYLLATRINDASIAAMFPVEAGSAEADLSFEGSTGSNLDKAFFQICIDPAMLPDDIYLLALAIENADGIRWAYLDSSMFHFIVWKGEAGLNM